LEKLKPQYPLSRIKELIAEGRCVITATAVKSAFTDFLLGPEGVFDVILRMNQSDFYKSMTTRFNSRIWQDVYHKDIQGKKAYIKVQILEDETVVISFKEK
jgi:motility quorum-sensing regulator/GCU-specific mRNA interferase toxin